MSSRFHLLIAICLACCLSACKKPDEYPLAGAPTGKPAETARIMEGSMFLRGLDDQRLESLKLPNPYSDYVFVIKPGRHRLMAMNIQSGHFLMPTDLRCYRMEADLLPGVDYILIEDRDNDKAVLKRQDNGKVVATGDKYEQKGAYVGACEWGK
jgi:hypothetical protein